MQNAYNLPGIKPQICVLQARIILKSWFSSAAILSAKQFVFDAHEHREFDDKLSFVGMLKLIRNISSDVRFFRRDARIFSMKEKLLERDGEK